MNVCRMDDSRILDNKKHYCWILNDSERICAVAVVLNENRGLEEEFVGGVIVGPGAFVITKVRPLRDPFCTSSSQPLTPPAMMSEDGAPVFQKFVPGTATNGFSTFAELVKATKTEKAIVPKAWATYVYQWDRYVNQKI